MYRLSNLYFVSYRFSLVFSETLIFWLMFPAASEPSLRYFVLCTTGGTTSGTLLATNIVQQVAPPAGHTVANNIVQQVAPPVGHFVAYDIRNRCVGVFNLEI